MLWARKGGWRQAAVDTPSLILLLTLLSPHHTGIAFERKFVWSWYGALEYDYIRFKINKKRSDGNKKEH
jgi:hypothetical protein